MYELQAYPGCFEPYNGTSRADTVFIIGYGTENEELFRKVNNRKAVGKARSFKPMLSFFQAPVTQICSQAIEELYSG